MTGYSGRPLHAKLGLKSGHNAVLLGAPENYTELLGPDAPDIPFKTQPSAGTDFIHLFTANQAELHSLLQTALPLMARDGMIWVSWPKKASKVSTDVTEDVIRDLAMPLGLVDVKVCAVDHIWSGLKLVIRKRLR